MSFSAEQKLEISEQTPRSLCCRRAFVLGVLASRGSIMSHDIEIKLDSYKSAEYVASLIEEIYAKKPSVFADKNGGRRVMLSFSSASAYKKLMGFGAYGDFYERRCNSCEASFLRGIFFASGKLSDPERQYSLEFSPSGRTDELKSFLEKIGLSPKIREKAGQKSIYFRKSTDIEDFLASANLNNAVFAIMNAKIKSDIRNNVNRVVNCETNNLGRAGQASGKSIKLISYLMDNDLLSLLPEELEATAKLRYANPELSLMRLAALHTPPISKPGISHRLKRIEKIAEDATKKNKAD